MKNSSKDKDAENKTNYDCWNQKNDLATLEEVRNAGMKSNLNKSEVITTADLFNETPTQFFRKKLKEKEKETTIDMFFSRPFVKKLRSEPNYASDKDW